MSTSELAGKDCVPCKGGVPPLAGDEIARLLEQVDGWSAERDHHITKTIEFPDFAGALAAVNRIGEIAEQQGHHPDLYLAWGKVRVDTFNMRRRSQASSCSLAGGVDTDASRHASTRACSRIGFRASDWMRRCLGHTRFDAQRPR